MCLTTTFEKGFIAPHDIIVYKKLTISKKGWVTPYMEFPVKLNSEMVPEFKGRPEFEKRRKDSKKIFLHGGVIHSFTRCTESIYPGTYYFKAIIRKGTRFWISSNLGEIASERLYITSEKVTYENTDLSFLYQDYCLDLLTVDGERIPWSPGIDPKQVKGIFAGKSNLVVGVENHYFYQTSFSWDLYLVGLITSSLRKSEEEIALLDFKGKRNTKFLRKNYASLEILKNLPEDFYIPALGELKNVLDNYLVQINLTLSSLGKRIITVDSDFWSSTASFSDSFWSYNIYNGGGDERKLYNKHYLLPFCVYPKEKEKKWWEKLLCIFR